MNIADGIRKFRHKHGHTQESLAMELGVARKTIANWESGEVIPFGVPILRLCVLDRDFPQFCEMDGTLPTTTLS